MSTETNRATVLRYFVESHNPPYNLDVIDETCSLEYGRGMRDWLQMEQAAFPDKTFTWDEPVAEGDRVVLRFVLEGTHLGDCWTPLGTLPATGRQLTAPVIAIYQLADGKIIGETNAIDWLDIVRQLGAEVRLPGGEIKETS